MQINRINSVNSFKGLWSIGKLKMLGTTKEGSPIYIQDNVYHPFKNEQPYKTRIELLKAESDNIRAVRYADGASLFAKEVYLVISATLGEEFDISEDEYNKMQAMQETPFVDKKGCLEFKNTTNTPLEVLKIAEELRK